MNLLKCCFLRLSTGSQPDQQLSAGDGPGYSLQEWMAHHSEQLYVRPLDQVLLPGTHDAGAYRTDNVSLSGFPGEKLLLAMLRLTPWLVKPWMLTQELDITNQLNTGIRFFDFRLSLHGQGPDKPPVIYVSHTLPCLPFNTVLEQLATWLAAHSQEVVLIRLIQDWAHRHSWQPSHTLAAWASLQSFLGQHLCCRATFSLPPGQLLPTFGDVVSCGKRLLVFVELPVQTYPTAIESNSNTGLAQSNEEYACDATCHITASNPLNTKERNKTAYVMQHNVQRNCSGAREHQLEVGQHGNDNARTQVKDGTGHASCCSEQDDWAELLRTVWGPGFSDSFWANSTTAEGTIKGLIEQIQQNQDGSKLTHAYSTKISIHRSPSVLCHATWNCMGSRGDSIADLNTTECTADVACPRCVCYLHNNQLPSYRYAAAAVTPTVDGVIENLLHAHGSTLRTYAKQIKQLLPQLLSIDLTGVSGITIDFLNTEAVTAIIQRNFVFKK